MALALNDDENDENWRTRMNINFLRTLVCLLGLLAAIPSLARQGDCGFIQNPDRQAYCRAISGGGSSHCGFIRDGEMQARCRAETGGGSSQCGFIRDQDMQAACRASAERANTASSGGSGQCGFIRDQDMQAACRAKTR